MQWFLQTEVRKRHQSLKNVKEYNEKAHLVESRNKIHFIERFMAKIPNIRKSATKIDKSYQVPPTIAN